jgi:hypothetical protein
LVGFSDKLRLMNLLIDDIRPFREFTIRGCREVKMQQKKREEFHRLSHTHIFSADLVTVVNTLLLCMAILFKSTLHGISRI